jgi:esterase/lipase superfamily enzyme
MNPERITVTALILISLVWTAYSLLRVVRARHRREPRRWKWYLGAIGGAFFSSGLLVFTLGALNFRHYNENEPKSAGAEAGAELSVVTVFFSTDRQPGDNARTTFTGRPASDGSLSLGICRVSVPIDRHILGELERPTLLTIDFRDWTEDPRRHFVIIERKPLNDSAFWAEVQNEADRSTKREALLFIHGYNVRFDDAIFRAAQLKFDLGFAGPVLAYSWPANGELLAYLADKENNEASVASLKDFLLRIRSRLHLERVHVIAHSMGNRALIQAVAQISREGLGAGSAIFHNIILAAPDVDRRLFRQLAPAFRTKADHVTLYASASDEALKLAKELQYGPRAGDADPLLVISGVDSIDASVVSTNFLNHSYFADTRLLADMKFLIDHDAQLPRFSIQRIGNLDPARWRFVAVH